MNEPLSLGLISSYIISNDFAEKLVSKMKENYARRGILGS